MNRKFALIIFTLGFFSGAHAGVKVTSLNLNTNVTNGFLNIALEGRSRDLPDLRVQGRTIEVTLSQAEHFEDISKKIRGANLTASMVNGKAVVKATLPYEIQADAVNLGWKNTDIEVVFPRAKSQTKALPVENEKNVSQVSKDIFNEDYLKKLENDTVARKETDTPKPTSPDQTKVKQDVSIKASAPAKEKKVDNFSFTGYAIKFTVFLALVLGLFYGVVQLLKKGVFRRGKLGFLNNTKMIEVLSTTYVSPKRSLMIVKAHKQVFLVANSENGLEFLSEMKDTAGLIKEGEKVVTGANFDTNLNDADIAPESQEVKLKEDITTSTPVEEKSFSKNIVSKDIVKFSDELKKKARKLKPIEFN